jgi:Tol biopolymer transport system component
MSGLLRWRFLSREADYLWAFNRNDGLLGVDWTPNGKIIYTAMVANSSTIWSMDADGSNAKELTPPGASDSVPSVAIDGHFIVFESHRGGTTQIWRMNVDGTSPTQLTNCGINSQPDVSPDGKWVVYVSTCGSDGGLWRISIDGGEPKRLADKPGFWPWVSPDSKWVACEYWVSGESLNWRSFQSKEARQQNCLICPRSQTFVTG